MLIYRHEKRTNKKGGEPTKYKKEKSNFKRY